MPLFVKIFLLVGILKLLMAIGRPFLCSGLYTGAFLLFGLLKVFGGVMSVLSLAIGVVIIFGLSSLYFWALDRIGDGMWWWVVLLSGMFLFLV